MDEMRQIQAGAIQSSNIGGLSLDEDQKSGIELAHLALDGQISEAYGRVGMLINRIDPILAVNIDPTPGEDPSAKTIDMGSDMARSLRSLSERVRQINDLLQDAIKRVDL